MAFDDTYRESIQTKHISNVGFTSTAKGVTNEGYALKNPHQVLPTQIPAVDVVGTYGALTASGIAAGLVEQHTVKLTADPTVNNNKAWIATEDNCTEAGHSARGSIRLDQWMRYAETQYKLRLYEDNGSETAPDYASEILPSETAFNWEYDASAGIIYFDDDPSTNGKTTPLWGVFFTYEGDLLSDKFDATVSGAGTHNDLSGRDATSAHPASAINTTTTNFDGALSVADQDVQAALETLDDAVQANTDNIVTTSGTLQAAIDDVAASQNEFVELTDTIASYNEGRILFESTDAVVDDSALTYVSGTQTLNAPNVAVSTDLTVGGDTTLDGTFGFDTGTTVNEIVTTVNSSSTDDQVATANAVYDHVNSVSGTLQSSIDTNATNITNNYNTLDSKIDTTSGTLQQAINDLGESQNEFVELEDTISTYNEGRLLFESADAVVDDADLTFVSGTNTLNVPNISISTDASVGGNVSVDGTFGFDAGTTINEIVTTVDSSSTDDQAPTAKAVYDHVDTVSGVLQTNIDSISSDLSSNYYTKTDLDGGQLDNRYYTETETDTLLSTLSGALSSEIDADIAAHHDAASADHDDRYYTETEIDTMLAAQDEFTELTDTISSYNEGRILFESADAVIDDADFTFVSGTNTLNVPNISVSTDLDVGGNVTVDGTFGFDTGTTINEIVVTVSGGTDDQVPTAKAVYDHVDSINSDLTDAIIWEVVDTPSDQIRPKVVHQGKAIYTAGNLTIGGNLTVSGTTTTVYSEELTVADKVITVNAGEAGAGITGDQYAGIEVDRGSETNYLFVFDEVQDNFRVGISGSLQAVATREDSPIDTRVPYWNDSAIRFDTSGNTYQTIVTTSGSGQIDMVADTVNVFSATDTSQRIGVSGDTNVSFNQTTDTVIITSDGTTSASISSSTQRVGVAGTTNVEVTTAGPLDQVTVDVAGVEQIFVDSDGLKLASGASVNEISTTVDASSTDDQLATAKAIYDEIAAISGTVGALTFLDLTDTPSSYSNGYFVKSGAAGLEYDQYVGHNADTDGKQGGSAAGGGEYYHLTSNEYNAFSSDGSTWTFSQAMALATGTSVDEISTTVGAASTDDQLATAKAIYDYVEAKPTTFIDLTDTISSFTNQRVLFTTASGVTDSADFTFDSSTGTLSIEYLDLSVGGTVNEITTTVVSGSTDSQLPTAKAVWDLTEAAAAAVHTHYDVDATHVSDTSWTYGTGFSATPDGLQVFVNGVKQRIGSDYDCTAAVPGGVLTITFTYSVRTSDWVNVEYYA